jgi:sec-independent protein translocase protein TatB
MFDVGIWEISLILIIALIVVGPDRLPTLATTVGRWVGKIRRMAQSVQRDIDRSIALEDQAKIRAQLDSIRKDAGDLKKTVTKALSEDVMKPLDAAVDAKPDADRSIAAEVSGKAADQEKNT